MTESDVLDALHPLLMKHGKPESIRSDNGPEFIAAHFQDWLKRVGIQPLLIYPGNLWSWGGIKKRCVTLFSQYIF